MALVAAWWARVSCRGRRNAKLSDLPTAARLGDRPFPHRQRPKGARLRRGPEIVQEPGRTDELLDEADRQAVHAGCIRPGVARDPLERNKQHRRVVHEVEQVVEPAARIGRRPTVKLGLYSRPAGAARGPHPTRRRCSPAHLSALQPPSTSRCRCRPSPCDRLSRPRTTPAAPPHPGPIGCRCAQPVSPHWIHGGGQDRDGSRVHCDSLVEVGARLCPCGIATSTPQTFLVASASSRVKPPAKFPARRTGAHRARPRSARFEPVKD